MREVLHKAKTALTSITDSHESQPQSPIELSPPSTSDVVRYRYQHGTNLGSIFVLERWLTGSMFPADTDGSAELAAAKANLHSLGLEASREKFEQHWDHYVSDDDLDWLATQAHATSVRLPIGFFTLGPEYCRGTAFESVADLYASAWACLDKLVSRCWKRGIGVLVDLHALPGGANDGEHSGTNSGKAEFWSSRENRDLGIKCLVAIAQQLRDNPAVAGLQLCNEAEHNAADMYEWYDQARAAIAKVDSTIPLYISDAWDLSRAVDYSNARNALGSSASLNPLVIDTHLYWCFSDADKAKHPAQIYNEAVPASLTALDNHTGNVFDHGAAQVVVGEYSCVLADSSWSLIHSDTQDNGIDTNNNQETKDDHVRAFGTAQSNLHQSRTGGSFFWTYKMDWMPGGEWGFKQQSFASDNGQDTNATNAIKAPAHLRMSRQDIQEALHRASSPRRDQRLDELFEQHCAYWDSQGEGPEGYEHFRFRDGSELGFEDAKAFFGMRTGQCQGQLSCSKSSFTDTEQMNQMGQTEQMGQEGADSIGLLDLWVLKRMRDAGQVGAKYGWEFEQGFRQGVAAFYELVGSEAAGC